MPDLLLIGGIRCGSTSLYRYLVASGCVGTMDRKEVHFYDRSYDRGTNWYRSFYPVKCRRPVVDATPSYLCTPGIAERAAATAPDARILVILRDPAQRAASHFSWRSAKGHEPFATLAEAMADEPNRMSDPTRMLGCYGLHSRYEQGLAAWSERFSADQLCVLIAEKIFAGDRDELARLHDFVDIPVTAEFPHVNMRPEGAPITEADGRFADSVEAVEQVIGRPTGWARPISEASPRVPAPMAVATAR